MSQPQPKPFSIWDKNRLEFALSNMVDNCKSMMEYLGMVPVSTPCEACTFFEGANGNCKKWATIVPPENRPEGCENFFFNTSSAPF